MSLFEVGESAQKKKSEEDVQKAKLICPTGSEELDRSFGGGIKYGSFMVIKGGGGSGKSVFAQQISFGAIEAGNTVTYFTSETTVAALLDNMKNLSFDSVRKAFIKGQFRVIPVYTRFGEVIWADNLLEILNSALERERTRSKFLIVDSLAHFAADRGEDELKRFFARLKGFSGQANTLLLTIPSSFAETVNLSALTNICGTYIEIEKIGSGRFLNVEKMETLGETFQPRIPFSVDPAFGIRVSAVAEA